MKHREIAKKEVDTASMLGTYASVEDVTEIITEDTVLTMENVPVLIYLRDTGLDVEPLRNAIDKVKWVTAPRASTKLAIANPTNRVFGYQPRVNMRNRPCNVATLGLEQPEMHELLCGWTEAIDKLYMELAPVAAKVHKARTVEKIQDRFHLADSMFTSGIINKTNQLPYHFDRGNFVGAWSAMLGLKKWIEGGFLVIPEYDLALEISDGSISLFDGQAFLHGVTPIKKLNEQGERYTIVWYSLQKLWLCLTTAEEVAHFNKLAARQANKKASMMQPAKKNSPVKLLSYAQKNKIEDVRELEYGMDFRRPEHRREVFMRFYEFHLKYKAHAGAVYYALPSLFEYVGADKEQQLWILYLNGCTQNIITTYFLFREFPDVHNTCLAKLATFMDDNWKNLQWDMDRRYVKAKTVAMVENYKDIVRGGQQEYFANLTGSSCVYSNFRRLWQEVINKYKYFGRLSTFSYLEYLRIGGVAIDCDSLFIDDINGSKSHRNGICKVMGRDDYDWTKENEVKYTADNLLQIEKWGSELLEEARKRIDHSDVSYFTLETTLCCYKGWHRVNRRYPNVYNDMFAERILWSEKHTGDKDLEMFWSMRRSFLPKHLRLEDNSNDVGLKPLKQNHYRNTGEVIMMHKDWDCFNNTYNASLETPCSALG